MNARRPRVLVVDDKATMRSLFLRLLADDYDVDTAADGTHALAKIASVVYDIIVTDVRMPGADGFQILETVKERDPDTEIVMMTAYAAVDAAVEAIKRGAYDYLEKPFDPDLALRVIGHAAERKHLREQAASLREEIAGRHCFHKLIGNSQPMQRLFGLLEKAARTDISVLLTGESGTGKELAARAIHRESARGRRRFVPINCGALPSELIENELFGHARGAFTGAAEAHAGLVEEAEGGTLFLDEIGELPLPAQVKLNRVLQEHEVRRVGSNRSTAIDVRIVAATNRDLKAAVKAGRFREDLFYRLNVFTIEVPPLRARGDDIRLLVGHFLEACSQRFGDQIKGLDAEVLRALMAHSWPGNVRELRNTIERAVAISAGDTIRLDDLPSELARPRASSSISPLFELSYKEALKVRREEASRDYLDGVMRRHRGNVTKAAAQAGIERESLHRLLKKHGLRAGDYRSGDDH